MRGLIDNSVNLGGKQTIAGEKKFLLPVTADNSTVFLLKNIAFGEVSTGGSTGNKTATFIRPFKSSVETVVASYVGTGTPNGNTPPPYCPFMDDNKRGYILLGNASANIVLYRNRRIKNAWVN